jgi:tetratricopeptide (TPR) repeat protein
LAAAAWLALAEGHEAQALDGMRRAAALEDSTEKRPVTPGAVLPARELLGDMLLETRRPAEALAAYEATLRDAPQRFNALAGASRAALHNGQRDVARRYAAQLLELTRDADGERPEIAEARRLAGAATGAR